MKNILLGLVLIFICSCSRKIYIPVTEKVIITETVTDTIIDIKIEKEYIKNIVKDTVSTVKTKYAESTAIWHSELSLLEHDIKNIETDIPVEIKYITKEVIKEVPAPYPVEVIKEVPVPTRMPLRWWEKILMYIGIIFIGGSMTYLVLKLRKIF